MCAVTGFSWGFIIRSGQIKIQGPEKLPADDWDRHGARLSGAYPGWEFAPGYRTG
ncbi:hypothetical protein [Nonomuraea cavernae]|uniref:hypothetical protein n=1 Tax=Nonomuraea cavernae TaxID=2045107 RepID=UPI0033FA2335